MSHHGIIIGRVVQRKRWKENWVYILGVFGGSGFFQCCSIFSDLAWLFSIMILLRTVCTKYFKSHVLTAVCAQIKVHRNRSSFLIFILVSERSVSSQGITAPVFQIWI